MKIASVINNDLANGPGIRTSVFVSGCPHRCEGCHNQQLWNYDIGKDFSDEIVEKIIASLLKDNVPRNLSILGGEPLAPTNEHEVMLLCKKIKERLPNINIWIWTGYTMEELLEREGDIDEIFNNVDTIVDGRFRIDLKYKGSHLWRGSSNQKIWYKNSFGEFVTEENKNK